MGRNPRIELFSKNVDKDGIILDVWCGYGRILEQLHEYGYRNLIWELKLNNNFGLNIFKL